MTLRPSLASWPIVSVGLLITLSPIVPVWLVTGMNVYLVALGLLVALAKGVVIPRPVMALSGLFACILAVGLLAGAGARTYDYFRDVWYVGNAALTIATGYVLYSAAPRLEAGLKSILVGCLLVSMLQMAPFAMKPDLLLLSAVRIREAAGTGLYASALGLCVLASFRRKGDSWAFLSRTATVVLLVVFCAAVVLSFSRTLATVAVMCVFVPFAAARGKTLRAVLLGGGGLAALLLVLNVATDASFRADQQSFVSKMARSAEELWVEDYRDMRSINNNWRGYETNRALREYSDGTPLQWIVGKGFGAQIDLGLAIRLGSATSSSVYSEVPILHNGYAYLLVKTGLIGLAGYLLALAVLFRVSEARRKDSSRVDTMGSSAALQAIVLVLVFTTWVISGAFNKSDLFPFLLVAGYLLGHLEPFKTRMPGMRAIK